MLYKLDAHSSSLRPQRHAGQFLAHRSIQLHLVYQLCHPCAPSLFLLLVVLRLPTLSPQPYDLYSIPDPR